MAFGGFGFDISAFGVQLLGYRVSHTAVGKAIVQNPKPLTN